jgi:hypothetical protein
MIGFWPISDRIIMVNLSGKPFNINIIQAYAPTTDHTDEDIEAFYEEIGQCMKYVKSNEIIIIQGDLNAKTGKISDSSTVGQFGLGTTKDRGKRLIEFAERYDLIISNTWYQHHARHLYTWRSPGDVIRNQIDYIMINWRYQNSIKNVRAFPGADINSDHNPVIMKMHVKLKRTKISKVQEHWDMNMLNMEENKSKICNRS